MLVVVCNPFLLLKSRRWPFLIWFLNFSSEDSCTLTFWPQLCVSVDTLCPCDEHTDACDSNCCCDADCQQEVALFTSCSVTDVRWVSAAGNQSITLLLTGRIPWQSNTKKANKLKIKNKYSIVIHFQQDFCFGCLESDLNSVFHCCFFTHSDSRQLCSRGVASYALRTRIDGFSELLTSIQKETNYDLFCIHSYNRESELLLKLMFMFLHTFWTKLSVF